MRTFAEFTEQLLFISVLGVVGIEVCLLLRMYVLAGIVAMTLVLACTAAVVDYYYHHRG